MGFEVQSVSHALPEPDRGAPGLVSAGLFQGSLVAVTRESLEGPMWGPSSDSRVTGSRSLLRAGRPFG